MEAMRAIAWYSNHSGHQSALPQRAVVKHMLADIEARLKARKCRPVSLSCQRWPADAFHELYDEDYLASITVEIEPGQLTRSLASWFQWQHPQWVFETSAPPQLARPPAMAE